MRRAWLLVLFVAAVGVGSAADAKVRVLVVTGGHGFERAPFLDAFRAAPGLEVVEAEHAKGSASVWEREDLTNFQAVVLYDMPTAITEPQQARFLSLFARGTGLVVLHHALVSYQGWPDYERIVGGRWPAPPKGQPQVTDAVGYRHGVEVGVVVVDRDHPITRGLEDFTIHDEIYWGYRVGADVHPLLTTTHPKSGKPLMWTRTEGRSRVVYLQLGHDRLAYENPGFRTLLARSIGWVAECAPAPR